MKRVLAATSAVLFCLAPALGAACEYNDASMASTSPAEQLGMAPAPAASKAPAPVVAKAPVSRTVKQAPDKVRTTASEAKLVAAKTN